MISKNILCSLVAKTRSTGLAVLLQYLLIISTHTCYHI